MTRIKAPAAAPAKAATTALRRVARTVAQQRRHAKVQRGVIVRSTIGPTIASQAGQRRSMSASPDNVLALTRGGPAAAERRVQRLVSRRALLPGLRLSDLSASFTAFEVLNVSATSGARTTTFVPRAKLAAYFPRTPPEKSYSGRISSLSCFCFLAAGILPPLASGRDSSTDEADALASMRMRHDHHATCMRGTEKEVPILVLRVVRIEHGHRQCIRERRR